MVAVSSCAVLFLSTPSARRATGQRPAAHNNFWHFYPRPPRGGRPEIVFSTASIIWISIHALREEGDGQKGESGSGQLRYFYPRPPRGGRPDSFTDLLDRLTISIHALREEGDGRCTAQHPGPQISIHALREEGDFFTAAFFSEEADFYPRPPRGGRRDRDGHFLHPADFYPRPPRGGRRTLARKRSDVGSFLSTPSARRATDCGGTGKWLKEISIHALREEGDCASTTASGSRKHFYPRPPRGGRRP